MDISGIILEMKNYKIVKSNWPYELEDEEGPLLELVQKGCVECCFWKNQKCIKLDITESDCDIEYLSNKIYYWKKRKKTKSS